MKSKKTAQEIQDEIFRKMPFTKKFHLGCDMMALGLMLKRMNKNFKRPKTTFENLILCMALCQKQEKDEKHSKDIDNFLKVYRGYLRPNYLKKQAAKLGITASLEKFLN